MAQKPIKKIKIHIKQNTKCFKKKRSSALNNKEFISREINKRIISMTENNKINSKPKGRKLIKKKN